MVRNFLLIVVLALIWSGQTGAADYSFSLNGKPVTPRQWGGDQTGTPLMEGSIILVDDFWLRLGKPGNYQFSWRRALPGALYRVTPAGEMPVALNVDIDGDKPDAPTVLDKLTPEEVLGLCGLKLSGPIQNLARHLQGLKADQLVLFLDGDTMDSSLGKLPALPRSLAALIYNNRKNRDVVDLTFLAPLEALEFLYISLSSESVPEGKELAHLKKLRFFQSSEYPADPANLKHLTSLATLDLSHHAGVKSVDWAAGLSALAVLKINSTAVRDLSVLSHLPALRKISASSSSITTLGTTGFTALTHLNLVKTPAAGAEADAFQQAHPDCIVWRSYTDSLGESLLAATKLRIRSGGTCHRDESNEKTLAEIAEPAELEKVRALLEFEEDAEPFHCMCCGEPSFEFYQGERLMLTLGFHHGHGMRWPQGPWPGDVRLKRTSAKGLCDWLEKHGVTGPAEAYREEEQQAAALQRRYQAYAEILPVETRAALNKADSEETTVAAIEASIPDPTARGVACTSLFGAMDDSWNVAAGLDQILKEKMLESITPETRLALLKISPAPANLTRGLARWFFEEDAWESADKGALQDALPALVRAGLDSGRPHNRQRTLLALAKMNTSVTRRMLSDVMEGKLSIPPLPEEQGVEPGGMVTFRPDTLSLPQDADSKAHAATHLLRLKDKEFSSAVENYLKAAPPDLAGAIRKAAAEE